MAASFDEVYMKKTEKFKLRSLTDIKIFLLFLLDNIRYPIDYTTLTGIISENVDEITFDYEACLGELCDEEHLLFDEIDGTKYYMISDSGRFISAELCDRLDEGFRESAIKSAARYISLSKSSVETEATVSLLPDKRYSVSLVAKDKSGKLFSLELTVSSLAEAEKIAANFKKNPDAVYRGILFTVTGRFEFFN